MNNLPYTVLQVKVTSKILKLQTLKCPSLASGEIISQ